MYRLPGSRGRRDTYTGLSGWIQSTAFRGLLAWSSLITASACQSGVPLRRYRHHISCCPVSAWLASPPFTESAGRCIPRQRHVAVTMFNSNICASVAAWRTHRGNVDLCKLHDFERVSTYGWTNERILTNALYSSSVPANCKMPKMLSLLSFQLFG